MVWDVLQLDDMSPSWCLHFFVHDCHSIRKKSWEALIVFLFAWCWSKWTIHQTMDRLVRLEGSPIIERRCNVICKVYAQTQWASPASHLPKVQRRCLFLTIPIPSAFMYTYSTVQLWRSQFSPQCSQQTPHSSPVRARYGVPFVSAYLDQLPWSLQWYTHCVVILYRVITALHCI